jgi:2-oxoisovalerate dehydrogenase E1 component beta subunit
MVTAGVTRDEQTFVRLEAPVATVAGWSIHTPLVFERFNAPDVASE